MTQVSNVFELTASEKGERGAMPRQREWDKVPLAETFYAGTGGGEKYQDIVVYTPEGVDEVVYYECMNTHNKGIVTPDQSDDWREMQHFAAIATHLFFANKALVKNLVVEEIVTADGKTIITSGRVVINGEIYARIGKIGGFEIVGDTLINKTNSALLILRDALNEIGVAFGTSILPAQYGTSVPAKIFNNIQNDYDTNVALLLEASAGFRNFGIVSNAALKAPSMIATAKKVVMTGDSSMPLSQFNIFALRFTTYTKLTLPTESQVESMFQYNDLPQDFACQFTIYVDAGSANVKLSTTYNQNFDPVELPLSAGDSVILLAMNSPHGFLYKEISRHYI